MAWGRSAGRPSLFPFGVSVIGMYVGEYYPHKGGMYNLGRRVKDIMSLPKEVIRYIKWVTTI